MKSPLAWFLELAGLAVVSLSMGYLSVAAYFTYAFPALRVSAEVSVSQSEGVQVKDVLKSTVPEVTKIDAPEKLFSGDKIVLTFNVPVNSSRASLAFGMKGSGQWIAPDTFEFKTGDLEPGTEYSISIPSGGILSSDGATSTSAYSWDIKSGDALSAKFAGVSDPQSADIGSSISVNFSQPVDHASAQAAFSIQPKVPGSFSWSGPRMTFDPASPLAYQTSYAVALSKGILPEGTGFRSAKSFSYSFKTEPKVIKLDVPYFKQEYTNSCEIASLRMALAFYGISATDMEIVQRVGYLPKAKDAVTNTWDDPRVMYVGDITTTGPELGGYGVYGQPIAKAAEKYGRKAEYTTDITPQFLARQIEEGYPVILWGYTTLTGEPYSWNVPAGGTVTAFKGEHARLVVGLAGTSANPVGFYVHDPFNGNSYQYWSAASLMAQVTAVPGVTNQAVVVR